MNDFYKDAIETLETLVKSLNGNHNGIPRPQRYDTHSKYKNMNTFGHTQYLSMRRKVLSRKDRGGKTGTRS